MPDLKPIYTGAERARLRKLRYREFRQMVAEAPCEDIEREIKDIERRGRDRAKKREHK